MTEFQFSHDIACPSFQTLRSKAVSASVPALGLSNKAVYAGAVNQTHCNVLSIQLNTCRWNCR